MIKFNEKACLKPYIDLNTTLKQNKTKKLLGEKLFQVDEKCSFWKNYGKCEKT